MDFWTSRLKPIFRFVKFNQAKLVIAQFRNNRIMTQIEEIFLVL